MQILIMAVLPFSLILIGLWLLELSKIKVNDNYERLSISYILSLAVIFGILYLGSVIEAFGAASILILVLVVVSAIWLSLLFVVKILRTGLHPKVSFFNLISNMKFVLVLLVIGLVSVYVVFLSSRAILDSDVAQEYLPLARGIVGANGFTYSNGYDYNILLKPIGVSVLYAWTYVVSGTVSSESFRLLPLVPIIVLIVLNYAIAKSATKSKTVGLISTAVFLVLPFQDRFLLYNAFYPDVFFYPLVFAAIYFLLGYSESKRLSLLFWTGMGFGVAGLLKAQTIYVAIAFVLVLVILAFKNSKKLSIVLFCLAPFYILIPDILASSVQNGAFHLSVPSFSITQWELLLFISAMLGLGYYYLAIYRRGFTAGVRRLTVSGLIRGVVVLLIPFALLSSLWYVNNLFRFGTLIWTSSINLPNYSWALGLLNSANPALPVTGFWYYVGYFVFMPFAPSLMGYVLLIPFIIGLILVLRRRTKNFIILLFFNMILASIVLSTVITNISSGSGYNPRDIFVLAPLLATLSAIGIFSIASNFTKECKGLKCATLSFLFVAFFGLLNYVHSVLVWFTNQFEPTNIGQLMSFFGNMAGLSLTQTSFQISYQYQPIFVGDNLLRILLLPTIAALPILALSGHGKLFTKPSQMLSSHLPSKRNLALIGNVFLIFIFLLIIVAPRVEMLTAQGGTQSIQDNQLKTTYGGIYNLISSKGNSSAGGILTYGLTKGLPYYMQGVKIIDLAYPANLAFLRDCLFSGSPYETAMKLRQQGIDYLLINPSITGNIDTSLSFAISNMTQDPTITSLSTDFGSWKLYTLGPYYFEKAVIPLSGWLLDTQHTNAVSYNFNSSESGISLALQPTDLNSRVEAVDRNAPKLNLSIYDYARVRLDGSNNSRIILRAYLGNNNYFDLAYWISPYDLGSRQFDLLPYNSTTLRGDIYLGLQSSDGLPSSINVTEISFIKIENRIPLS